MVYVEKKAGKLRIYNIETVIGSKDGYALQKEICNLIFMRDVFHHIEDPVSYFAKLWESIKPGGRIAIINWKRTKLGYIGCFGHYAAAEEIKRTFEIY